MHDSSRNILFFIMMLIAIFGGAWRIELVFGLALSSLIFSYFFSQEIALALYQAKPLEGEALTYVRSLIEPLVSKMGLPIPRLWTYSLEHANAMSTGRDANHASIVISKGLLKALSADELSAIFAHELSHIKNRDMLVRVVASIGIFILAYLFYRTAFPIVFAALAHHLVGLILGALLLPFAVPVCITLVTLAICRSREYLADATSLQYLPKPELLASTLQKVDRWNQKTEKGLDEQELEQPDLLEQLFSTHPPISERVSKILSQAK